MSYTVENLEKSMAKITITVDADAFEEAMVKSYNKNKKNISIQGFRKGKAPRKMVAVSYTHLCCCNDIYQIFSSCCEKCDRRHSNR